MQYLDKDTGVADNDDEEHEAEDGEESGVVPFDDHCAQLGTVHRTRAACVLQHTVYALDDDDDDDEEEEEVWFGYCFTPTLTEAY
jgi:hypothetical protein